MKRSSAKPGKANLAKCPTGIKGFDEITGGGLPAGRPTLVCGNAGCGKTILSTEFLVHGTLEYDEPGVFMAFEETAEELMQNAASLGFDLAKLVSRKKMVIDFVRVERNEIEETGEYDLEGLFVRLDFAISSIGARRVVLDTIESLFSGLKDTAILRAELRRLFRWLKDRGVTAIITGERGDKFLTRHGLEEYVSDCVILLDHRVSEQQSTRRLRVVKYRGSTHGTNEYPFLIEEKGISILPVTSLALSWNVSSERVSTGISRLDEMLGGEGYFRGSSILVSGTAGVGKTTVAAHFATAFGQRGERCMYCSFEEPEQQILRNMRSVGLELERWVRKGLLRFHFARPTHYGLELHLAILHKEIEEFGPATLIIDPVSSLEHVGSLHDVTAMLLRLLDFLKMRQITVMLTQLTNDATGSLEKTEVGLSSLIDTWLLVRDIELNGERNRALYVLKSRGMAHSNQIREFVLTSRGVQLVDAYLGTEGVLTGSARLAQEARDRDAELRWREDLEHKKAALDRRRTTVESQIAALRSDLAAEEKELHHLTSQDAQRTKRMAADRATMARSRGSTRPQIPSPDGTESHE
jgi:circadian clock protein KaiC